MMSFNSRKIRSLKMMLPSAILLSGQAFTRPHSDPPPQGDPSMGQRSTPTQRRRCTLNHARENWHSTHPQSASMAHAGICLNKGNCVIYKPEEWSRKGFWWGTGEWGVLTELGNSAGIHTYVHGGCNEDVKGSGCGGTEGQYVHVSVHAVRKSGNSTFKPGLIGSYEGIFSLKLG